MKLAISLLFSLIAAFAAFAQEKPLAEDFSAVSIKGDTVELKSLRGKVVVLTFWSTKCEICRVEIPKLNKIVKDHEGREVVFLAVTMNNESMVNSFTKKNPFSFNILPNGFGVLLKYADKDSDGNIMMGFPSHYVIDQAGQIEFRATGVDKTGKVESALGRLLAAKKIGVD